ncbi:phosphoglycerate kinase [Propylenella binzhouense]|uniref:Phosphoglycerate kinase n=1 Tax=Propylenella binzhouense TaxID=2555902 RepID=A0A964T2J8_9HYPH|nr:phosphoglycerate kinase [Propylenella binzhouense]MYZ47303.1 phosphoglycerate kinase [Propylenella binzhouense]
MSLDAYAFAIPAASIGDAEVDIHFDERYAEQLATWRRDGDLHSWMSALYARKGGRDDEFYLSTVRLNDADLDRLRRDIGRDKLGSDYSETVGGKITDRFIANAKAAISDGMAVVYHGCW